MAPVPPEGARRFKWKAEYVYQFRYIIFAPYGGAGADK